MTVIPQDPTLFNGTLRYNLDPYGKESTEVISELLGKAGLDDLAKRGGKSDFMIAENGSNLSVGEK